MKHIIVMICLVALWAALTLGGLLIKAFLELDRDDD